MLDLRGNIPPVLTPLHPDGRLDRAAVTRLTAHFLDGGVSGLFVLGSCGEGAMLSARTRAAVIEAYREEVDGRVPVLAGVPEFGTRSAVESAERAMAAGADAVVVMAPQYFPYGGWEPVAEHLHTVASNVGVPTVLYNLPSVTQNPITPAVVAAVGGLPNVIALKDSSADWDAYIALADAAGRHGLAVFQGAERFIARSLARGADGVVAGISNIDPAAVTGLVAAQASGDTVTADRLQRHVDDLCALYGAGFWLGALKAAVSLLGLCGPATCEPSPAVDAEALDRIKAVLDGAEQSVG